MLHCISCLLPVWKTGSEDGSSIVHADLSNRSSISGNTLFPFPTLCYVVLTFNDLEGEDFLGKGENTGNQYILLFLRCFLPL